MLSHVAKLLPVVASVTQFIKNRFNLKGKQAQILSWAVSMVSAFILGQQIGIGTQDIITLGLLTGISANGGYELIEKFAEYVGIQSKATRKRKTVSRKKK